LILGGGQLKGKVYLVGAGPGDPELLTVRAVHRLRRADVVLHDALISSEVLALASPSARVVNVGKRCGTKCITQAEINSLLIALASEGNIVVRLKSGDPLLFGRAGEEIEALQNAEIEYEIVPGITSAVAAAASAGISLTDRRCSDQVLLVSAHHAPGKPGPDWKSLVSSSRTTVIYMPGNHSEIADGLMHAGLSQATPCVLISKVSLPQELAYRTTLETLRDAPALPAPSLLIVGEIACSAQLPEFKSAEIRNDDSATLAAN
jgi:uroporphyrin-III C-methyltransferase